MRVRWQRVRSRAGPGCRVQRHTAGSPRQAPQQPAAQLTAARPGRHETALELLLASGHGGSAVLLPRLGRRASRGRRWPHGQWGLLLLLLLIGLRRQWWLLRIPPWLLRARMLLLVGLWRQRGLLLVTVARWRWRIALRWRGQRGLLLLLLRKACRRLRVALGWRRQRGACASAGRSRGEPCARRRRRRRILRRPPAAGKVRIITAVAASKACHAARGWHGRRHRCRRRLRLGCEGIRHCLRIRHGLAARRWHSGAAPPAAAAAAAKAQSGAANLRDRVQGDRHCEALAVCEHMHGHSCPANRHPALPLPLSLDPRHARRAWPRPRPPRPPRPPLPRAAPRRKRGSREASSCRAAGTSCPAAVRF